MLRKILLLQKFKKNAIYLQLSCSLLYCECGCTKLLGCSRTKT